MLTRMPGRREKRKHNAREHQLADYRSGCGFCVCSRVFFVYLFVNCCAVQIEKKTKQKNKKRRQKQKSFSSIWDKNKRGNQRRSQLASDTAAVSFWRYIFRVWRPRLFFLCVLCCVRVAFFVLVCFSVTWCGRFRRKWGYGKLSQAKPSPGESAWADLVCAEQGPKLPSTRIRVSSFERSAGSTVLESPARAVSVAAMEEEGGAGYVGLCLDCFSEELILVSSVGRAFGF